LVYKNQDGEYKVGLYFEFIFFFIMWYT